MSSIYEYPPNTTPNTPPYSTGRKAKESRYSKALPETPLYLAQLETENEKLRKQIHLIEVMNEVLYLQNLEQEKLLNHHRSMQMELTRDFMNIESTRKSKFLMMGKIEKRAMEEWALFSKEIATGYGSQISEYMEEIKERLIKREFMEVERDMIDGGPSMSDNIEICMID